MSPSGDRFGRSGTCVVVEVVESEPPGDLRSLLAVQLGESDPLPGAWALCWRLNYTSTERLDLVGDLGRVTAETLDRVGAGVHAVIEP